MLRIFILILASIFLVFAQSNEDCMLCHGDPDLTGFDLGDQEISMYVDGDAYQNSIHADFQCIDCHMDLADFEDYPHDDILEPVSCGACHDAAAEEYSGSLHGLKFIGMEQLAPKCSDCHGKHNILTSDDSSSKVYFQNLPRTCGDCHARINPALTERLQPAQVLDDYMMGVHGKMVIAGDDIAPTCNTCHPAHNIRKRIDPQSTIYRLNVASTCGECHIDALAEFSESIHSRALTHGILESATCTDCHGEHQILHPSEAYLIASHDACIDCHTDPQIQKKYNLPETVVSTYEDSYHGLSARMGRKNSATCGSCHRNHEIQPASDPYSSINENQLVQTCEKCHDGATESFAKSYTHESMLIGENPVNYYVTIFYVTLIFGLIGGMVVHNLIIFVKYVKYKKKEEKNYFIVRFRSAEIFQHGILLISFTLLAISGFALKFPDAWWVRFLESCGCDELVRRMVHRVSAVVLIAISFYHLYYIIFTTRGRYLFKQILPVKNDVLEVLQTLKYYVGISDKKPIYDEFDYTEKVEYWAVVWGTVIMGLTGFILWFPTLITGFSPSWIIRAAELVHYYEAILATLAIVVFHLFFVIAHPEQYPMNLSWLTGKMSLKAAIRKHPKWIDRIFIEKENLDLLPEVIRKNCESIDDVEHYLKFGEISRDLEKGHVY